MLASNDNCEHAIAFQDAMHAGNRFAKRGMKNDTSVISAMSRNLAVV